MAESEEEMSFLRIISLLYKVAPSAVRVKFDKEFHPTNGLETALRQNKFKVLEPLKRRRVINQTQWDLLFPSSGTVTPKKFDLTLMICLIRHLTPIQIGYILPLKSDVSDGADLSRLKYYRNMIAHYDAWTLTSKDFETYWNDICQAILNLGGPQFKQICEDLKDKVLNNNDQEILIELRNSQKESRQVPKTLQKIHEDLIYEWGEDNNKVVKTRAIHRIEELLKSKHVIVAVGSSGCGKSTAIHHVALQLQKQEGYYIVPVHSPEDIIQYCEPKYKQVFVIDDVCGKSTIDIGLVNRWTTLTTDIKQITEDHKIKILLSCRRYIYLERSFEGVELLSQTACDLVSSYSLTEIERNQIARIYLTESQMNAIKKSGLVEKFSVFPLLCCLYSKQKLTGVLNFFANPISVIKSDLGLLRKATDQTTLATMSLFIVFNNSLDENILSRSHSMTKLLEAISDHFHLQACFSIKVVKSELQKLEMSYVKKTVTTYRILHDKIYDIFLSFCGEHFFDLVLEVAHRNITRDRFVLESIQNENQSLTKDENVITVPDTAENNYFKRILKDVKKGSIKEFFLNRQFKCLTFRNKLFQYLWHELDIKKVLLDVSSEDLSNILLSMTRQCYWDMVPIILTEHVDVNVRDWEGTPLYFASVKGNIDIAKVLLENQADPNIQGWLEKCSQTPLKVAVDNEHKADYNVYRKLNQTPLFETVSQENSYLTMLLLNHGADPNIGEKDGNNTPLHIAFSKGNSDMIKILLDYKGDLTIKNVNGEIPLFKAVEKNDTDIVRFQIKHKSDLNVCNNENESLLFKASRMEHNCDHNICNDMNVSPLLVASVNGHTDIVTLFLEHNCDHNICNDMNVSPLFAASKNGHTDLVTLLLEHNCDPIICNDMTISPLFAASENGHTDIVKSLLGHHCDPGKCNNDNVSPLFVASANGHIDIVRLLLEHDCNPNMCNDRNEPPLFISSKKGHINIVKLLSERSCDVHMENKNNISSLFSASENGHTDIVKLFLEHNCDPNSFNKSEESVLSVATKKGHIYIVKLFFAHDSNPNICNSKNESVLFGASKTHRTEIVKFLLEHKCDPNICNDKNESSLFVASKEGHADIVKLLLEHNCDANICYDTKESPLFIASTCMWDKSGLVHAVHHRSSAFSRSTQSYTEIVKLLLEHNCDHNTCNAKNESPLFTASSFGHTDIVRNLPQYNCDPNICNERKETPYLLLLHCDPNMCNDKNESPLFIASTWDKACWLLVDRDDLVCCSYPTKHSYTPIVKLLLEHGCDPNTCNAKKESAFFGASKNGQIGIAKLLLEHNCDPNICNDKNESSLFIALKFGYANIVKLLLEHNCDSKICNDKNESPLFIASQFGHANIVKLLLEHNCDPKICNDKNESPLFIASKFGKTDIVKLLLEHNCDPNICNDKNESPLFIASNMGHASIVKLLLEHNCDPNICNDKNESTFS
ncbi:unnamed protein product [Mytilus coruscus]|uniref:Uncharacterized protein n=1 Tax=Mytilus coruscus TaxID=42192 RepID=A0A6J8D1W9_MYTCO|nr:unnamed protein product [Mytilus coruscus]